MSIHKPLTSRFQAFTLIEMLVVIAVIGVLAGLILPAAVHVMRNAKVKQAQSQRDLLTLSIDGYKDKRGQYPPDNPANCARPPLVNELTGVRLNPNKTYTTLRGNAVLAPNQVVAAFGIGNFMNASVPGSGDDAPKAINFAGSIDVKYIAAISNSPLIELFVSPNERPVGSGYAPIPSVTGAPVNPWNYVVTNPTNNTTSYDLWVDLKIGKKIYRICNWSEKPIVANAP